CESAGAVRQFRPVGRHARHRAVVRREAPDARRQPPGCRGVRRAGAAHGESVTDVAVRFGIVAVALAIVAALSPAPDRVTDREVYEKTEARTIVQDCSDLHCFRVLLPWVPGVLPGPSPIKWKAYSVVCNAAAAAGVFVWCLPVGVGRRAASV